MCQAIDSSKTFRRNPRVSHLLIVTGLTLMAVKSAQSMPSRDYSEYGGPAELDHESSDYGEPQEQTRIPKTKSERRIPTQGEGPVLTKGKTNSDRDAIRYPEDWERSQPNFAPQPLPTCEGKTFCEDSASPYPQEYLNNLINKTGNLKIFSRVDTIEIGQRVDSSDGGAILCGSQEDIVYPKTAQNGKSEWLFVIQAEKEGFKQGVKVENCDKGTVEGSCKIIEGSIFGYKTSCKQKYVSRVLAAMHKNGTAVTENFTMPSSCCCQLKRDLASIGSRSGGFSPKGENPGAIKPGPTHN